MTDAARRRTWRPPFPVDPWLTLAPLRHGPGDPTMLLQADDIWRASRTAGGPVTLQLQFAGGEVLATAWGPGAEIALDRLPRLLGADDDPSALQPPPGLLRDLAARTRGLRLGACDWIMGPLLPAICEQKVTANEAQRAYRGLVAALGEPAPGPGRLLLPPTPEVLAGTPYWAFHPFGMEQRRADTIRRAARRAAWLEEALDGPSTEAMGRLQALSGIGPWTAAQTVRAAMGDPDAVSMGDVHLPHLVAWALAGEPRGDDARMLDLLAPYAGQRARVVRLLELSGIRVPRRGPRCAGRSIASM